MKAEACKKCGEMGHTLEKCSMMKGEKKPKLTKADNCKKCGDMHKTESCNIGKSYSQLKKEANAEDMEKGAAPKLDPSAPKAPAPVPGAPKTPAPVGSTPRLSGNAPRQKLYKPTMKSELKEAAKEKLAKRKK